jgi:hypothetical protein
MQHFTFLHTLILGPDGSPAFIMHRKYTLQYILHSRIENMAINLVQLCVLIGYCA